MTIETVLTCPLGSKCEEVRDGKVHRCSWFVKLAGTNPQTGAVVDEQGCAMAWVPVLLIENTAKQTSTAAAVESFRNEMVSESSASRVALSALLHQVAPHSESSNKYSHVHTLLPTLDVGPK